MILISKNGLAFPPMFFHSGGVREFLGALRLFVTITRSDEEPNLFYLSEYSSDPASHDKLRSSLESLEKSYAYSPGLDPRTKSPIALNMTIPEGTPVEKPPRPPPKEESFGFNLLESFSRVTAFARNAGKEVDKFIGVENKKTNAVGASASNPDLGSRKSAIDVSPTNKPPPPALRKSESILNEKGFEMIKEDIRPISPPLELAHVYRTNPLNSVEWKNFHDDDGRVVDEEFARAKIHSGGVEPEVRKEVWKYLLRYYPWNSTAEERQKIDEAKSAEYLKWKGVWQMFYRDPQCKFTKLERKAHAIEKDVLRTDRHIPFYSEEVETHHLKSLHDILLTYCFLNYDLGYVQGMNELLSPIFYVIEDEATAFWCFHGLMQSFESNFHRDQNGMHTQLLQLSRVLQTLDPELHAFLAKKDCLNMFFCFRWILIHFKREFSFEQILRLWEVMWSNQLTPNFHLFIAISILLSCKEDIMKESMNFDDMVKYINDRNNTIHLEDTLTHAEQLYIKFKEDANVEASLRESIQIRQEWNRKPTNMPANAFLLADK